jgi:hypothetical protein
MEIVPGLLSWIDQQKQAIGSKFGLLADNPREYFRQIEESARDINRQDKLAVQGGKAQLQGLLPTPDQQAAMQARDQRLQDFAMGFVGSIKAKTPYELAHEVAQKNAVEMLGLPPNNTAMDRARALGYDQPVYRGTKANETSHAGNVWVTDTPEAANYYAGHVVQDEVFPMLDRHQGGNVMPMVGSREFIHGDAAAPLWNGGSRWQVPAEALRSRFAAFDPARINEPDLLAVGIPLGLIAGTDVEIPKNSKKK